MTSWEKKKGSYFMQDNGTGHKEKKKRYLANSRKFVDYGLLDLQIWIHMILLVHNTER
jgi:hypothetical protein